MAFKRMGVMIVDPPFLCLRELFWRWFLLFTLGFNRGRGVEQ